MYIKEKTKQLIESRIAALATVCPDGRPNVIAVGRVKVVSEDELVITDYFMNQTRKNILANKNVCLAVWNEDGGVKVIGTVQYFKEGQWFDFVNKLNWSNNVNGVLLMKISEIIELD